MAAYQIFIPGVRGANNGHLKDVGLDALCDGPWQWYDMMPHLEGVEPGMCATIQRGNPETDPVLGFHDDRQTWTPAKADEERGLKAGRFWIGVENDRPVMPGDIARDKQVVGNRAGLRDGHGWMIPIAEQLPHVHGLDSTGKVKRRVDPRFQEFCDLADGYMKVIFREFDLMDSEGKQDETFDVDLDNGWRFCLVALSLNYFLTPEIVDVLELIDDASMVRVISAAIDLPAIIETRDDQKKTQSVGIPLGSIT